jgi:hypothetical protein
MQYRGVRTRTLLEIHQCRKFSYLQINQFRCVPRCLTARCNHGCDSLPAEKHIVLRKYRTMGNKTGIALPILQNCTTRQSTESGKLSSRIHGHYAGCAARNRGIQ